MLLQSGNKKQQVIGLSLVAFFLFALLVGLIILIVHLVTDKEPDYVATDVVDEEMIGVSVQKQTIGRSVNGRTIEAYKIGSGAQQLLFVGGMHGGYEFNSILLAERFIDAFKDGTITVPENVTVHIIPSLNPDGEFAVVGDRSTLVVQSSIPGGATDGTGRFNANGVDLNRNFDCKWQAESSWRGNTVSAGTAAFSEPEARALRDYVYQIQPEAVVFWHSQANAVYASECEDGILPITLDVMNLYAQAAGYQAVSSFDAYPVTGDAEGWLASIGIPAVTVEMSSHQMLDWEQNILGVEAVLGYFEQ